MLYYYRTDMNEGIDPTKAIKVENAWFVIISFFNHGFNFQDYVCNDCHDLTILSVNINEIAILTATNVDYCCIIHNIRKSEAINLLKNSLLENRGYI